MSTNSNHTEVDYNIIDYDVKMTTGLHDLGPCRNPDNDEELLRGALLHTHPLREKRPRKERLESIRSHLMDINIAILTIAGIVFVSLVMNMAYTAINVNPNPVCYFSANNDFKDNTKSNGDFCIPTDKEDKVFYCCKGDFHWCLRPECESKFITNNDGYSIANLTITALMLFITLFIIVMMFQIVINFKKIFDNMYWGDWSRN